MTTDQLLYLVEGLEPFLAITALNILLAIWILSRIKRNHRDITAVKNLLTDIRSHEVSILKPALSSSEQGLQPDPQAPKPEPTTINVNTDSSEIDGFLKALQEGTDIDEAAKQFHLTEDEASVAVVSYRSAKRSEENSDPIS
jgi:hypothetical protein